MTRQERLEQKKQSIKIRYVSNRIRCWNKIHNQKFPQKYFNLWLANDMKANWKLPKE